MADDPQPPIHGGVVFDSDDPSPPQNVYDPTTLTPMQASIVRSRIKKFLADLYTKRAVSAFSLATSWVLLTYSYGTLIGGDFTPLPSYGAGFLDFAAFVYKKELDREADEIVEGEESEQRE